MLRDTQRAALEFQSLMTSATMEKVAKAISANFDALGWTPVPEAPPGSKMKNLHDWDIIAESDGSGGWYLLKTNPLLERNLEGISKVHIDSTKQVAAIELSTGRIIVRPKVTGWLEYFKDYLLLLSYPVLGFLLPWGCVRILAWVGYGFIGTDRAR